MLNQGEIVKRWCARDILLKYYSFSPLAIELHMAFFYNDINLSVSWLHLIPSLRDVYFWHLLFSFIRIIGIVFY